MSKRHCSSVKGLFISGSESVDIHFEKKLILTSYHIHKQFQIISDLNIKGENNKTF